MGRECWEFMGYSSTHIHNQGLGQQGGVASQYTYDYGDSDNRNNTKKLLFSKTHPEGQSIVVRGQRMEQGLEPVLEMPEGRGETPVGSRSSPCSSVCWVQGRSTRKCLPGR